MDKLSTLQSESSILEQAFLSVAGSQPRWALSFQGVISRLCTTSFQHSRCSQRRLDWMFRFHT